MSFTLPFAVKPKIQLHAVGNEDTGILYLKKINGRTGIERKELDVVDEIETQLNLLLLRLAQKIATEKQIEVNEALQLIFTEDKESDTLASYTDEIEKMMVLKSRSEEYRDLVVSVMLRERIAYPVTVLETASKGSKSLKVSLNFDIPSNSAIKFENCTVYSSSSVVAGSEDFILEESLMRSIEADSVGFLLNDSSEYVVGNPDWSVEHTRMLPDSIAAEIFQFYQSELAGSEVGEAKKKNPQKKPSKSTKGFSKDLESTGETFIGESNLTELQTIE